MIAIVNYGLGNVQAFANVYKTLGIAVSIVTDAASLKAASKIILPGVGSFDHAMNLLDASGMRSTLEEQVLSNAVPILGVCVGMQIMAHRSEEGALPGLGWIDGTVAKLSSRETNSLILPHMGWNDVTPQLVSPLFSGLERGAQFYFLHSFAFQCTNPESILAASDYGGRFTCAIQKSNIYGVQFHPEKSHDFGARLLRNFAGIE